MMTMIPAALLMLTLADARDPQIVEALAKVSAARIKGRVEALARFGTRHTMSDTESPTRGIGAARRWIKAEFDAINARAGGRLKVEIDGYMQEPTRRIGRPVEIVNVVATLPGKQPESAGRIILVSGHYDSRASDAEDAAADAPGANDDASGTAVVMELAEVLAELDLDATVVFAAFAGEEQGLLGSGHYAKKCRDAGLNIEAMITNDIVGNTEGSGGRRDNSAIRVFSEGLPAATSPLAARLRAVGGENDSPSRQLARYLRETAALYGDGFDARLVFRTDRYLRGGDHSPFLQQGYAAVRLTEPSERFDRQHQNVRVEGDVHFGDVPASVDYPYVADVARLNAATVAGLALAPPPPADATLETAKVENDTTIRWSAVAVPDLKGYEVLWRDSTAPDWEHSRLVGDEARVTLPRLSKDDLHFGVRAVDAQGHKGLVAYPLPPTRRP